MSTAVVAAAVASQQSAAAGAVLIRPAAVVHTPGPCPPAEESLAWLVENGVLEVVGPARPGEGKPFQYRAVERERPKRRIEA